MRLFHVSDTHLGYSAFARLDPNSGINQREVDFYDSFERFVDFSLKEMPDIILHTGDLFDSVRPSNRAISFALEQISKVANSGIQFVAISGNHETPRLKETGNVFKILDHLSNCRFAYEGGLRRFVQDGIEILCIPHSAEELFHKCLSEALELKNEGSRIVMMHAGLVGLGVFRTDELNELILTPSEIDQNADYVALGHYHNFTEVTKNACYSGSTERLSIVEANSEKGFIDIDLDSGKRRFIPLPTRRMIDITPLELHGENASTAKSAILHELEAAEIDGAIVRMTAKNLPREAQRNLDMTIIRKMAQRALHFELKIEREEEEQVLRSASSRFGSLEEEFRGFLTRSSLNEKDKKRIEKIASEFFAEREE